MPTCHFWQLNTPVLYTTFELASSENQTAKYPPSFIHLYFVYLWFILTILSVWCENTKVSSVSPTITFNTSNMQTAKKTTNNNFTVHILLTYDFQILPDDDQQRLKNIIIIIMYMSRPMIKFKSLLCWLKKP
jgi:hypothetical protein